MKESFALLFKFLNNCTDESERQELLKALKKIEKEYALTEFKANRFFNEKTGLAAYLEKVTGEYEKLIGEMKSEKEKAQSVSESLESTLKKMQSSIGYAKRIQDAILGDFSTQANFFKDSFVFFRPKDIVSGDFYWFGEEGGKKIICGADCTGHGVSGAFMTLIANNHFNEIIRGAHTTSPDKILKEVDELMYRSLHFAVNELIRDGMDTSIVCIDEQNKILEFAGAHHDLLIFRGEKRFELEGENYSIDGILAGRVSKIYKKHRFEYHDDDCFYIYTDGFKDQFGGSTDTLNAKKYGSVRFKQKLAALSALPMSEQKKILQNELTEWSRGNPQTDDIMLIGVRL
jgi:serine phosphatase RsbU (regulator of sigma subunit)